MSKEIRNYGMLIPLEPMKVLSMEPDPNGVPIYQGCKSKGPCACLGTCRKIIGYDTDPVKVAAYHEAIKLHNEKMKERFRKLNSGKLEDKGNGIKVWTWETD